MFALLRISIVSDGYTGQVGAETKWNLAGPECGSRTMDCFFEPLSNCRLEDVVDEDTPNVYLTPDGYLHPKVQVSVSREVNLILDLTFDCALLDFSSTREICARLATTP